jgi:ABC-type multidrug transport system ATPase subunit/ABC-type multidrug transport system permease subunit
VAGSAYAQLFYSGVEQFYCQASSCTQQLGSANGTADWQCSNLQCTCIPGTSFCGGVPAADLTGAINSLAGNLEIDCGAVDNSTNTATCNFKQSVLDGLFGSNGLILNGCSFGECVQQGVIDIGEGSTNSTQPGSSTSNSLSGGVIAGLAVIGSLIILSLFFLFLGLWSQRAARRNASEDDEKSKVTVQWSRLSYVIPGIGRKNTFLRTFRKTRPDPTAINDDKVILDNVNGKVRPGQMMAILGPSGAGKTSLVEILSGKNKSGVISGRYSFLPENPQTHKVPRVGFVPQQDILPPTLTVFEAILFAARLRLPENITDAEKHERVDILLEKLGIAPIKNQRIGDITGGRARGISGGEMRRVTIGLELIACPDVLLLDEPTSGLDSVSAARVADILYAIAHDPVNPTPIIASIHQPSSQLYQKFDLVVLLSHGRALYSGPGGFAPAEYFSNAAPGTVPPYQKGYNVAEYLLEVANDPPVGLFQLQQSRTTEEGNDAESTSEKPLIPSGDPKELSSASHARGDTSGPSRTGYATTFLTQLQHLCGREWKTLKRDKTLFVTHLVVACILGVLCGGLYFRTNTTIAGFQSRVGCLFFLGALIAFSSLSALYNIVEIRPLFLRERSGEYYSPTAWLLSRFIFDMIPLRLIPTIIVSSITYWMAGLAPSAVHFFKFLLVLVLYTLTMTLYNFLLGTFFKNGGIAILLSALSALYQMTFAGFFLHLDSIPPALRWLQWLCPLKYNLEALAINEVSSGLQIVDTLQGVPIDISAIVIVQLLFGFELGNYYRDVLILVGFILGFGISVIGVVWFTVRERR